MISKLMVLFLITSTSAPAFAANECNGILLEGLYAVKKENTDVSPALSQVIAIPVNQSQSRLIVLSAEGLVDIENSFKEVTYASLSETQIPGYCTIVGQTFEGKGELKETTLNIIFGVDERGSILLGGDRPEDGANAFLIKRY